LPESLRWELSPNEKLFFVAYCGDFIWCDLAFYDFDGFRLDVELTILSPLAFALP
jgi:hypothetical protein